MAKLEDLSKEQLLEEIKKLKNQKKYGLVWEDKPEQVVEDCKHNFPVLTECAEKKIIASTPLSNLSPAGGGWGVDSPTRWVSAAEHTEPTHLIIEGDNYHALSTLNVTHKGKIDVIYIDPPYNTGNKDFMYNDTYVDVNDDFRHSKWISFMEKRLVLSRDLLKQNGIIFISIDDNEQANLKLLCDIVFGENNFISLNVIETANGVFGTRASQTKRTFVKVKDYVLVYAKSKNDIDRDFCPLFMPTNDRFDNHYSIMLDENYCRKSFKSYLEENEDASKKFKKYGLSISLNNISKLMQIDSDFNNMIIHQLADKIFQDVDFSLNIPDDIDEQIKNGNVIKYKNYLIFRTNGGKGNIRQYISFKESLKNTDAYISEYRRSVAIGDLWEGFDNDMKNVTKEGDVNFSNGKKPIRLIKQLSKWNNVNNALVLDFFAGSGTTGHAVLELNKEDGGNRQFILCTNNENNICEEVTYPRIKKVIEGYGSAGSSTAEGIPANVRYFKTDFIPRVKNKDQNKINITQRCTELLCLKEGIFEELLRLPRHCGEKSPRHCGLDPQSPDYVGDSCFRRNDDFVAGDSCFRRNDGENELKYQIFKNGNRYMAVYYGFLSDEFYTLRDIMNNIEGEKILYCFTLNPLGLETDDFADWKNIHLEPIPQKILDVYNQLFKK